MSDNYKVIRRIRKIIEILLAKGWSHSKICYEIGISAQLGKDILAQDEVTIGIRQPTAEKMKAFLERFSKDMEPTPKDKPKAKPSTPEEVLAIQVPPSMEDAIPATTEIGRDEQTLGLLGELSDLSKKFARQGYRLDASLTLQQIP